LSLTFKIQIGESLSVIESPTTSSTALILTTGTHTSLAIALPIIANLHG